MQVVNNEVRQVCPLCGSASIRSAGPIKYLEPIRFSDTDIALTLQPELWRCGNCRSGFTQNIIPQLMAARLYLESSSAERWSNVPFSTAKTRHLLEILSGLFAPPKRVLDIGCNTGELLDYARSQGCRTFGVEPSTQSREIVAGKGHPCVPHLTDLDEDLFDIICAFDVVEHLYDVGGFLDSCHSKLKSGGMLAILTGDIACLGARLAGTDWWYLKYPEHIVFPSQHYFRQNALFQLHGWIATYASIGYDQPWLSALRRLCVGTIRGDYNGLPSPGPDHRLILLRK